MAVVFKPFEADYGYKSPGFSVDTEGNVVVRTITNTYTPPVIPPAPDYNVNESQGTFTFLKEGEAVEGSNPTITLERGATYNFVLNLNSLGFNIFNIDENDPSVPGELYNVNIQHQNVVNGLNLSTTTLSFTQTWQQELNGFNRTVQTLVPDVTGTPLENKKLPIVIVLHDQGDTSSTGIALNNWISDSILIAPQGYDNVWNVGYQTSKADDISFIDDIITSLANYDNVDLRTITLIGYGNGAQLAMQYYLQTTNAAIKNLITFNGLLHEDQYNPLADDKFYSYDLNDNNADGSTIINWTPVEPIISRKVLMFNGQQDLRYLYLGGEYQNQNLYSAVDTVYAFAQANQTFDTKLTEGVATPDSSLLFSYNNSDVRMFSFENVANNFTLFQNSIRSQITTLITPTSYEDVPVSTILTGEDAQNKVTGTFTFEIPVDAPDFLYYSNNIRTQFGSVAVVQPSIIGAGVFSSILDTGDLLAEGQNAQIRLSPTGSGTVIINPATTGTVNNVNINAQNLSTSGNVSLTPNADVTISPQAGGTLTLRPTDIGLVDNVTIGSVIPRNGTFSTLNSSQGTLNNTTIGLTTAAQAAFTVATVQNDPASANDVTKKEYVDNTATVLAIALGV